jgi:Uma2 family endonuclease
MAAILAAPGERIIRNNVPWEEYERLLAEHDPGRGIRIAYDEGTLEIMVLSLPHEEPNRILASLVEITAEETGRDFRQIGSTTIQRKDLRKGFEPDSCYYIKSISQVEGKRLIDFTRDPGPDLVIEVDVSNASMNKFPLFAAVRIGELWRYSNGRVRIYRLREGRYVEQAASEELPPMTSALLTEFLELAFKMKRIAWLKHVREWVRANR